LASGTAPVHFGGTMLRLFAYMAGLAILGPAGTAARAPRWSIARSSRALDRLTILSAAGDAKVADLSAHAELKRSFCGRRNPILAATPEDRKRVAEPRFVKLNGRRLR
jgi:hypothetical protein